MARRKSRYFTMIVFKHGILWWLLVGGGGQFRTLSGFSCASSPAMGLKRKLSTIDLRQLALGKMKGASLITHAPKEYSGGKNVGDGVKRIAVEQRQRGFQQSIKYALKMSIWERLVGHPFKR